MSKTKTHKFDWSMIRCDRTGTNKFRCRLEPIGHKGDEKRKINLGEFNDFNFQGCGFDTRVWNGKVIVTSVGDDQKECHSGVNQQGDKILRCYGKRY